ncbi:MAG: hypothetical protein ACREBD_32890 [Blastocatellia bacterium]
MMLSFAHLFRENDGASRDLFWWCFRLAIIFTLFGTGRAIINTASQIGYDIINVTEFRKVEGAPNLSSTPTTRSSPRGCSSSNR